MRALVIWKDVKGFEGIYKVSSEGVLVSLPRFGVKGGVKKRSKTKDGYERYRLSKDGKSYRKMVHRLLAEHFIPNPENKPYINHIDCNRANNSLDNLEWVTQSENILHASKLGRLKSGENHYLSVLTDKEVREVRDLSRHKVYTQREIGELYGVPRSTISNVVLYRSRKVAGN